MKKEIKVVMMGLGYIGLPTAALIASKKIDVQGVDITPEVVATVNKGEIHIIEPDLEGLVKDVVNKGYLKADIKPCEADVFIIAVPTPLSGNNTPNISYIQNAVEMVMPFLRSDNLLIIESTSPIFTTEKMADIIYSKRPELKDKICIAYCPERVLPGHVIYELENNDRVIGGIDEKSTEKAMDFYFLFVKGELHQTNTRTAEMCKLVENAYRDVNIAFANELSIISDKAGINISGLINLANRHPRVNILQPGPGVGGHCIAVDPWFLISAFSKETKIIRDAREVNLYKSEWVLEQIREKTVKFDKNKLAIACMGITYKPDIDDLRESPALRITISLVEEGYRVYVAEPNIEKYNGLEFLPYDEAVAKADIIVFLVAHREFRKLMIVSGKVILDFCGISK